MIRLRGSWSPCEAAGLGPLYFTLLCFGCEHITLLCFGCQHFASLCFPTLQHCCSSYSCLQHCHWHSTTSGTAAQQEPELLLPPAAPARDPLLHNFSTLTIPPATECNCNTFFLDTISPEELLMFSAVPNIVNKKRDPRPLFGQNYEILGKIPPQKKGSRKKKHFFQLWCL